jgi:hypothetical protein
MAFVHPQSCECLKSELDIFAVPPTQTSIESGSFVEYHPISSLNNDGSPIEFVISGSGADYIDLSHSLICVKAEITRSNGEPLEATSQVGPVNLFLHSLFSDIEIKLNDVLITNSSNTYAYRAYLETLLSYSPAAKQSQLTASLYYKDSPGGMDERNPLADQCRNAGLKKRHSFFVEGRHVDMLGSIHGDIFFQERYLPSDVGMRIRLVRNKDAFCLMSSQPGNNYKVKIHDCAMFIRKVKLSPAIILAHAKAFEVGNAKYPIRRVVCKTFTIPTGNLDFTQENVFSGVLPTRMVIGIVDNDAFNGSYEKNPFNFKHYDLTRLRILLDGQQNYIKPIETNFAQHQYLEAYLTQFIGTGKQQKDEGTDLSRTDFANGYAIYTFDLTPDLTDDSHFNLAREGNVRIELKFANPLANTVNVILYAEHEQVIEFDRNKEVLFDFKN